jgi:hypothetical protein
MAVRRVNELGFYSLSTRDLAKKTKLTIPKLLSLIRYLDLQASDEFFKEIKIGKSKFKRYTPRTLDALKKALQSVDMVDVWNRCRPRKRRA